MTGAALTAPPVEMHPVEVHIRVMLTPSRALDEWLDDLERRDYSAKTITEYSRSVGLFVDSLPRDLDVSKVTLDTHINPYLRRFRNRSRNTIAAYEAALCSYFEWITSHGKVTRDPCENLVRTRRPDAEDLDVVTVSGDEVRRMMFVAQGWPERLAINVLAYLGPRRAAASQLRIGDFDRGRSRIRFKEKGRKTIYKPIPESLDMLIEEAIAAGVYAEQDYLIPSPRPDLLRLPERCDDVILRLVKDVAKRAGCEAHAHALRAAFACFYLELNPGDVVGLKNILGHKRLSTTEIYLRKLDKERSMEPVRGLSWGVADPDKTTFEDSRYLRENRLDDSRSAYSLTANDRLPGSRKGKRLEPNESDGAS